MKASNILRTCFQGEGCNQTVAVFIPEFENIRHEKASKGESKRDRSLIRHTSRSISLGADYRASDLLPLESGGLRRRWTRTVANISIGVVSSSILILGKGHQAPSPAATRSCGSCGSKQRLRRVWYSVALGLLLLQGKRLACSIAVSIRSMATKPRLAELVEVFAAGRCMVRVVHLDVCLRLATMG